MVRCSRDSLYTGIAKDVSRRIDEHEHGTNGAKYLRGRGPLQLVFQYSVGDRSLASKVEYRIKQLNREEKEALSGDPTLIGILIEDCMD